MPKIIAKGIVKDNGFGFSGYQEITINNGGVYVKDVNGPNG